MLFYEFRADLFKIIDYISFAKICQVIKLEVITMNMKKHNEY